MSSGAQVTWDAQPSASGVKWDNAPSQFLQPYSDLDQLRQQSMQQAQQVGTSSIQPAVQNARKWQAAASMPLSPPIIPGQQIATDVKQGNYSRAAHEAITGAGKAYSPLAIPAAITPSTILPFLAGIGGGAAVGKGAKSLAGYLGANPDRANLIGDIGGVAGGIGSGMAANAAQDALTGGASELSDWMANKLRYPATTGQAALGKAGAPRYKLPFLGSLEDMLIPKGNVGSVVYPSDQALPPGMAKDLVNSIRMHNLGIGEEPQTPLGPWSPQPKAEQLPAVNILPEPREPFEGENEGYMGSVKRKDLLQMAKQGKPGAGKQIQNLGKTVIYAPPTGYPGPRTKLPWEP